MQSGQCPTPKYKRIEKFLGLTGYRNHINHYPDITNNLTKLLKKVSPTYGQKFRKKSFSELKNYLQSPPILIYPDLNKPYFSFADVCKHCWKATLCQHTPGSDPDSLQNLKPIMSILGNFCKTQCNYTALVREAFAINTYICQKT